MAVIPARGGSKRIPRKNVRTFCGRPIIRYSIETAIASGLFQRVIVSTDDEEIAAVALECGAEVPFRRPAELSGDYAGTMETVAHAVSWVEQNDARDLSAVCCIYATVPFLRCSDLRAGWQLLDSSDHDFVFAATTLATPVQRAFFVDETRGVQMFFPEHFATRSQDLPESMCDAAQFYWGRPQAWLGDGPMFGARSGVVRIPRWRVQDIDTEDDWVRAEAMMSYLAEVETAHG